MIRLWMLVALTTVGCTKNRGPLVAHSVSSDVVVSMARSRVMPQTVQGRFSVHIDLGDENYTVPAAVLLDQPDKFRFEVYTPFGTPLYTMASDGDAIHVWSQRSKTFYEGEDASAVLQRLTGGQIGIDDVLGIVTGVLPMVDAEILHVGRTVFEDDGVVIVMLGPDDIRVRAVIDPRHGMVRKLRVDPASAESGYEEPKTKPLLEVEYEGQVRNEGGVFPSAIEVGLPQLGWTMSIQSKRWKVLDDAPDAFTLTAPPRSTTKDLRETIESIRP